MKLKDLISMKLDVTKKFGVTNMSMDKLKTKQFMNTTEYNTRCDIMDSLYQDDRQKSVEKLDKVTRHIIDEHGDLSSNLDYAQNNYSLYCKTMDESEEHKLKIAMEENNSDLKPQKISFGEQDPYIKLLVDRIKQKQRVKLNEVRMTNQIYYDYK